MPFHPDIAVYSADGKLLLLVEIKGMATTDATWAAQYRRNLLAHHVIPPSPYFLLVASDRMYLWANPASMNEVPPHGPRQHKGGTGTLSAIGPHFVYGL